MWDNLGGLKASGAPVFLKTCRGLMVHAGISFSHFAARCQDPAPERACLLGVTCPGVVENESAGEDCRSIDVLGKTM